MALNIKHDATTWGLSISEFESMDFGKVNGTLKFPNSTILRFRTLEWQDADGNPVPEGTPDAVQVDVFDVNNAFNNACYTIIKALTNNWEIFRSTNFSSFLPQDREKLRLAVYAGFEHASMNNSFWEKTNTSGVSTSSYNLSNEATPWLLSNDIIGLKANNILSEIQLQDYVWEVEDEVFLPLSNGMQKAIIGKVDLETVPELI